eukprot:7383019-Prymnesium_polylepis.1
MGAPAAACCKRRVRRIPVAESHGRRRQEQCQCGALAPGDLVLEKPLMSVAVSGLPCRAPRLRPSVGEVETIDKIVCAARLRRRAQRCARA